MDKIKAVMEELAGQEPVRVILSKPKVKSNECKKVDIHRYRDFSGRTPGWKTDVSR